MAFSQLTSTAVQLYDDLMNDADPRTKDWLLMSSPLPQISIICAYIYFVTSLGPRLMENRKPFDLKKVLVIYNFTLVALSVYMCYEFVMSGWGTGYSFRCDLVDYSHSLQGMRMAHICWLYFFSRLIEMLDTVFFVLRKKNNQITFLHVFHHSIMPFTWWFGVKLSPAHYTAMAENQESKIGLRGSLGGMGTFHAPLNCIVHIIMYTYYGLSALGPAYQKFLWWKKHLTSIQLIQFVMITTHITQYFLMEDCPYKYPIFIYLTFLYGVTFLALFLNFWYHAYIKGKRLPKVLRNADKVQNNNSVSNSKQD